MKTHTTLWLAVSCLVAGHVLAAAQAKPTNVNPDAKIISDFTTRVGDYVKLRNGLSQGPQTMKKDSSPQEMETAEKTLAAKVVAARSTAKRGDMFTPATEALFRRLLNPVLKGTEGGENTQAIKDDAPAGGELPYKINASYPKSVPLSTVPPDLLQALPKLPEDIQYRFAGKNLILYDSQPNVIVDFMLNALP